MDYNRQTACKKVFLKAETKAKRLQFTSRTAPLQSSRNRTRSWFRMVFSVPKKTLPVFWGKKYWGTVTAQKRVNHYYSQFSSLSLPAMKVVVKHTTGVKKTSSYQLEIRPTARCAQRGSTIHHIGHARPRGICGSTVLSICS